MADRSGAFRSGSTDTGKGRSGRGRDIIDWLKQRILAAALAAASTITFLSLISPWWLDFMFDIVMVGLIAIVGKLVKERQ